MGSGVRLVVGCSYYLIFNILLQTSRPEISEMSEVFQSHWFYEIGPLHEETSAGEW